MHIHNSLPGCNSLVTYYPYPSLHAECDFFHSNSHLKTLTVHVYNIVPIVRHLTCTCVCNIVASRIIKVCITPSTVVCSTCCRWVARTTGSSAGINKAVKNWNTFWTCSLTCCEMQPAGNCNEIFL